MHNDNDNDNDNDNVTTMYLDFSDMKGKKKMCKPEVSVAKLIYDTTRQQ